MFYCIYFVYNFKIFRRYFLYVRLFFLLDDFGLMSINVCILIILIFIKCNLNKIVEDYKFFVVIYFFLYLMIILFWCKM